MRLNIPNILSCFRLLLIPVTAYLFHRDLVQAASLIFILACLTDVADGYIARKYDQITDLGKILDPLADKGMQITVLVSMASIEYMPWAVVAFILCKELMMVAGGALLYRSKVVVGSNWYGKAATVVTSVCVTAILFFYDSLSGGLLLVLQWLPVAFAVFAFLRYIIVYANIKSEK